MKNLPLDEEITELTEEEQKVVDDLPTEEKEIDELQQHKDEQEKQLKEQFPHEDTDIDEVIEI